MTGIEVLLRGGISTPPFQCQERSGAVYELAAALYLSATYVASADDHAHCGAGCCAEEGDLTLSAKSPEQACHEVAEVIRRAFPEIPA